MKALTIKGRIEDYLGGIADETERVSATEELNKFYSHTTGICCLTPKRNGKDGCDNCGDTWRPR